MTKMSMSNFLLGNFMHADVFCAYYLCYENKHCPFSGKKVEHSWATDEAEHGGDTSLETAEQFYWFE